MAITSKGAKWEWKNSWFILLVFILPIIFVPFFIMYGRVSKPKYLVKAIVCILLILAYIFVPMLATSYYHANYKDNPSGQPDPEDYLGPNYWQNENYEDTDEYKQYQKDMSTYQKSAEYLAVHDYNSDLYHATQNLSSTAIFVTLIALLLLAILAVFVDRPRFLREYQEIENKRFVSSAMQSAGGRVQQINQAPPASYMPDMRQSAPPPYQDSYRPVEQAPAPEPYYPAAQQTGMMLDVNRMSEDDFARIPLINVIDAKNIVQYRNAYGPFTSKEKFFDSFQAKPHVIAKLSDSILIRGDQVDTSAQGPAQRRFDL